jgi:hypothetical protein
MAKHQVFLVHGMGNFEPGWSAVIRQKITDAFSAYKRLKEGGFASAFEFKEITYNRVFESWREQWRTDAAALAAAIGPNLLNQGVAKDLIAAAKAPTGTSFWQTHVLDVVMYRCLLPVTEAVCRSVQEQILGHLQSFPVGDRPPYSVIAHSLGTAVVYETFHAMLTSAVGPDGLKLGSAFYPTNVFMISNVAKALWNRGGDLYTPDLGPNLTIGQGLCRFFGNYRHSLDPFSSFDPFVPTDNWFAPTAPRGEVYEEVTLRADDMQEINIHSLEHYLGHPDVHAPILRTLVGWPDCISPADQNDALAEWRQKTLKKKALSDAQSQMKALLIKATDDWVSEVPMLQKLRELLLAQDSRDGES